MTSVLVEMKDRHEGCWEAKPEADGNTTLREEGGGRSLPESFQKSALQTPWSWNSGSYYVLIKVLHGAVEVTFPTATEGTQVRRDLPAALSDLSSAPGEADFL